MRQGPKRPDWIRVIQGGKADAPAKPEKLHSELHPVDPAERAMLEKVEAEYGKEVKKLSDKLWKMRPADFDARVDEAQVWQDQRTVSGWSNALLYEHLSDSGVWDDPTFLQAIFIDIQRRVRAHEL